MIARSDVGTARSTNEDFCGIFEEDGLAIVCDGMGGHRAGAEASRLAVTTIRYMYRFLDPTIHFQFAKDLIARELNIAARLVSSIRLANRNVFNKSMQDSALRGMGTTVSAMLIHDGIAVIAHVGDSRIYRIRNGASKLLTEDHTWVNELIQDEEIGREEAKRFEKQNVITRAIGLNGSIKIDVGVEPVEPGDLFLICTDGLTKALSDEDIKRIILFNEGNLEHTLQHLIDTATMKDGSDNITVALIEIEEVEPVDPAYQPIYLTLNAESKNLTRLEDKILKKELYHRSHSESSGNNFKKVLQYKYSKLTGIATVMSLVVFIGLYAFTNHNSKLNGNYGTDLRSRALATNTSDTVTTHTVSRAKNKKPKKQPAKSAPLPDSVVNKLVSASFDNKENWAPVSKVRSRSLQKNLKNRGKVYLTNFEKLADLEGTLLYVNNRLWGKVAELRKRDIILRPGQYTITLRDSSDKILFQKKNIKVASGNIKAIEIKGM